MITEHQLTSKEVQVISWKIHGMGEVVGSISQWKQRTSSYKCHKLYPEHREGKEHEEGSKKEGRWDSAGHKGHEIQVEKVSSISEATRSL